MTAREEWIAKVTEVAAGKGYPPVPAEFDEALAGFTVAVNEGKLLRVERPAPLSNHPNVRRVQMQVLEGSQEEMIFWIVPGQILAHGPGCRGGPADWPYQEVGSLERFQNILVEWMESLLQSDGEES